MSEDLDGDVELVRSAEPRFVLVTGAGRSGTSTIAGSLHRLGLHLPLPVLGTNPSNPRGFYESKWAIDFHRKIFQRALIDTFDARPRALQDIENVITSEDQAAIEGWLKEQSQHAPQLVVKDPRSAWMPRLWGSAASNVGLKIGYIAMLRHPAEVIGSRSTYYAKGDAEGVRQYQVMSIARWVNANLICERRTRGAPRSFVRYDELILDWRRSIAVVRDELDLTLNSDLVSGEPHAVDQFIDPTLRRHQVTWQDLDVPGNLREVAEETWQALCSLADARGPADDVHQQLDQLTDTYAGLFRDAEAIAHDVAVADAKKARRKAVRATREKVAAELEKSTPAAPTVIGGTGGMKRAKGLAQRVRGSVRRKARFR